MKEEIIKIGRHWNYEGILHVAIKAPVRNSCFNCAFEHLKCKGLCPVFAHRKCVDTVFKKVTSPKTTIILK